MYTGPNFLKLSGIFLLIVIFFMSSMGETSTLAHQAAQNVTGTPCPTTGATLVGTLATATMASTIATATQASTLSTATLVSTAATATMASTLSTATQAGTMATLVGTPCP
jgi:hypothetical protein